MYQNSSKMQNLTPEEFIRDLVGLYMLLMPSLVLETGAYDGSYRGEEGDLLVIIIIVVIKKIHQDTHWSQGRAQDLSSGARLKAERAGGVLGEGQQPPPHHLWGMGECCELSRRGSGQIDRAPSVERCSTIFSTIDGLFCRHIVKCDLSQPLGARALCPLCVRP